MARHDFRMPDIGEGIVDAEVVAWHVAVGERVEEDAPLVDVMTDKATVEITSPVAGLVVAVGCEAGERITIGERLAAFETGGTAGIASAATDTLESVAEVSMTDPEPVATPPLHVSNDDDAMDAADGQAAADDRDGRDNTMPSRVAAGSGLDQVENLDATRSYAAARTTGDGPKLNAPRREDKPHIRMRPELASGVRRPKALASPVVRRRARELGIELAQILGSGEDGRVLTTDLEAGARARAAMASLEPTVPKQRPVRATGSTAHHPGVTADATAGAHRAARVADRSASPAARLPLDEDVPVIGLRRIIAERLAESSREIPHFTYVEEVDVTELETLRQYLNARRTPPQTRLSLLHFLLVGVCRAVRGWPQCNAHHDDARGTLRCHSAVHLGVATMTDEGLLVPVVRDADGLDIDAMAQAVAELAAAARAKRLSRERLSGSTITVTSLGALAGIATTPIINRPETAIIGPNRITSKLVLQDGRIVERQVMNVSSSFDHRIVDGHDAATFIAELKARLEHPATLFM